MGLDGVDFQSDYSLLWREEWALFLEGVWEVKKISSSTGKLEVGPGMHQDRKTRLELTCVVWLVNQDRRTRLGLTCVVWLVHQDRKTGLELTCVVWPKNLYGSFKHSYTLGFEHEYV